MGTMSTLRRGALEAAFILVSILLAFAIDASWEGRQESRLESAMVRAVAAEVRANRAGLANAQADAQGRLSRIDDFLTLTPTAAERITPEEVTPLTSLSGNNTHLPIIGAATNLLESTPSDSAGLGVRELVANWTQRLSGYEQERLELKRRQDALQHQLSRYASLYPTGGVGPTDLMLRRGDARLVADIRADEAVASAVVDYGGQLWFYSYIIDRLLPAADSLLAELAAFES